jgi:hypothetical protein
MCHVHNTPPLHTPIDQLLPHVFTVRFSMVFNWVDVQVVDLFVPEEVLEVEIFGDGAKTSTIIIPRSTNKAYSRLQLALFNVLEDRTRIDHIGLSKMISSSNYHILRSKQRPQNVV